MDSKQTIAFRKEHGNKKEKDFRLEVLKMSKEDIYDFWDNKHSDDVHGWRLLLQESNNKVRYLEESLQKLNIEIRTLLSNKLNENTK